ncbi:MAG: AAA family ATPase [Blautia sp.]|nr:AAA family ATPase [Blautia sp.]
MYFLNTGAGYTLFKEAALSKTYVDKTMMIDALCRYRIDGSKYICVTRPRRFGKSVIANMISAFFDASTREKSQALFEGYKLGSLKKEQEEIYATNPTSPKAEGLCWPLQGKLKVIRINMIDLLDDTTKSYADFRFLLDLKLREDLKQQYPNLKFDAHYSLPDLLTQTESSFVFVINEWDAIFEKSFLTATDKKNYLDFLKALLKDKAYVHFTYMTGILPIAKYTSGSPLNMFHEFSAFQDDFFYPYFGLSREEIQELMEEKGFTSPSLEELTLWYDGYVRSFDGIHMYNPQSVSRALLSGRCRNYWTGTGPMDEVRDILEKNVQELREDIIRMVGGETLPIELTGFGAEKEKVSTKDEILSAMVVYGFLSYSDGQLCIPNYELLLKFKSALSSPQLGLKQTLEASKRLLNATLEQKDKEVAALIEDLHTEKIPFFQYNDENSLACVVTMGYLAALDTYRITREDKAGKGYADFTFEPRIQGPVPIILELKYNHSVNNALKCIKDKGYISRFQNYPKVLLVGINYSEKTKKHTCKTEMVVMRACKTL